MFKIVIIGSGNVATHLIQAFSKNETVDLIQAFARKKENLLSFIAPGKIVDNLSDLKEADLYIIAVSDDAIEQVANQISFENKLVVHTSGSYDFSWISNKNRKGVFYPLQTFSKNKAVDFKTIPLCLEAENEADYAVLEKIAKSVSDKVYQINYRQRQSLHVAAVFVNNFVNHLYHIGSEICDNNQVDFGILKPLIEETANKINQLPPKEAQTGPAKRQDFNTIERHLNFISDDNQKNIYQMLTQSILSNGKKL
jgi:predicted short-subunit dehydrogenase-like oxidoreductase (DUF2520 family)